MKKPVLQALLIAGEEQKKQVFLKEKRCIIREGWRDYRVNENILIGCHVLNWCVLAKVTLCKHLTLDGLTLNMLNSDGYVSLEHAIDDLSLYYPNVNKNSLVTYIEWEIKEN